MSGGKIFRRKSDSVMPKGDEVKEKEAGRVGGASAFQRSRCVTVSGKISSMLQYSYIM